MQSSFRVAISGFILKHNDHVGNGIYPTILVSAPSRLVLNPASKGQRFFKTVIYLQTLIMASAFCNVILYLICRRSHHVMLMKSEYWNRHIPFSHGRAEPCCSPELPDVVRNTTTSYGRYEIDSSLYEAASGRCNSRFSERFSDHSSLFVQSWSMLWSHPDRRHGCSMYLRFWQTEPATHAFHYDTWSCSWTSICSARTTEWCALSVFLFIITGVLSLIVFRLTR